MVFMLIYFAFVVLTLLMFKVCGITGVSTIEVFKVGNIERLNYSITFHVILKKLEYFFLFVFH